MWIDYGLYGLGQLWNNIQTYSYVKKAGIGDQNFKMQPPQCTRLPELTDAPVTYVSPALDPAPWYSASYPESAEFAGLYVTDITGFETLGSREVSPTPFGSVTSRRNLDPKTLTVTGWLTGSTCCAVQYGYRWLISKLLEQDCDTGEEVSQLSLYDCCPTAGEAEGLTDEEIIEEYLRVAYRVKVAKDPVILQKLGSCCADDCSGTAIQVQWTFVLENPKFYRQVQLCATQATWPEDIHCLTFADEEEDCVVCDTEDTVTVQRRKWKTRLPVAVTADQKFCPIGWTPDPMNWPPENSYIDIVSVETKQDPLLITVAADGTFTALDWDPTVVDLCSVNVKIAQYCSASGVLSDIDEECSTGDAEPRKLKIGLNPTSAAGGTWHAIGWTFNNTQPLPPLYSELEVYVECACEDPEDSEAQIILNPLTLTWIPHDFVYSGMLPPVGKTGVRVRQQSPGMYWATETVPVSEAFSLAKSLTPPDPYEGILSGYCAPLEWVQQCCKMTFNSGIEYAEPYLEVFSGGAYLSNIKFDIYALSSAEDLCPCDDLTQEELDEWACREPLYSIRYGHSIPPETRLVYDPRDQSIRAFYGDARFDASSLASSKEGGSPYFVQFPNCYGVCVVVTAEAKNSVLPDAESHVTVGYVPFSPVGV